MICVHLCHDVYAYKKRAPFHSDLPDFPHMLSGYLSYKSEMKEHYFNIQAYTKWCHQSRRLQDQARPTVLITSHIDVINLNNTLHKILLGYFIQSPQAYWSGHLGHPQSVRSRTFTVNMSISCPNTEPINLFAYTCVHYLFLILTYPSDIEPDFRLDNRCKVMEAESERPFCFPSNPISHKRRVE